MDSDFAYLSVSVSVVLLLTDMVFLAGKWLQSSGGASSALEDLNS